MNTWALRFGDALHTGVHAAAIVFTFCPGVNRAPDALPNHTEDAQASWGERASFARLETSSGEFREALGAAELGCSSGLSRDWVSALRVRGIARWAHG